ncbi:hypothetical protein BJ742DRAFT_815792 [Cladochytrium replicatum]|nr:hypothetical protein BJ742DRAFT_815792 [Cladochytrium replicatum]
MDSPPEKTLLPSAKAQAYIACFDDALDQLAVLGQISSDVGGTKQQTKPLTEEITRILRDQKALESRYKQLVNEQERLRSLPNKTRFKEGQLAIADITNELQQSKQVLSRNLRSHPSIAQNLFKIQTERSTLVTLISKTVRELRDGRFDTLAKTVEEEYKKRNTLQSTMDRESQASELLKDLQRELANEKKLLEEEVNDRNQVIQQLKDTIQEITVLTASEQKYIKKETKAHETSVRQRCQAKENQSLDEKAHVLKLIEQENIAHDHIVEYLARQREALEKQIQDWMTRYEEDTESKTAELEALKQNRTSDLDQFEELVAAYEELERVVEEDRQTKVREAEEGRVLQVRTRACTRIQRWWRRKQAEQKAAKSAKSGKKGKKGTPGKGTKAKTPKSPAKTPAKTPKKK